MILMEDWLHSFQNITSYPLGPPPPLAQLILVKICANPVAPLAGKSEVAQLGGEVGTGGVNL